MINTVTVNKVLNAIVTAACTIIVVDTITTASKWTYNQVRKRRNKATNEGAQKTTQEAQVAAV